MAHNPGQEAVERSLFEATNRCSLRLEEFIAKGSSGASARAQGLQQMLELWARHSGARAREGMSLDDRLGTIAISRPRFWACSILLTRS